MKEFHPNEQNNSVALTGQVDAPVRRRTAIKLSEGPRVMVVIPVGPKRSAFVLECPKCKDNGEGQYKYSVDQGFALQGMVPLQFMLQHMNWLPPLNVTMSYMTKSGMLSAQARQIMTMETLKHSTVKYIFYVDDDMIIPPMGLYTLYNAMEQNPGWGAVTGVYTTRNDPPEPLVYTDHGMGASWDFECGPGAAPKKIMGAGAGCLLARVEAVQDWMKRNDGEPVWCDSNEFPASNSGRVTWGHDVRFIRNLTEAGWPCFVDGRVLCGHYDIASGKTFGMPANAPGFKKRNVNTEAYWDGVYGQEGMDTWCTYEPMYLFIERHMREHGLKDVFELGCGSGVLGQRLTASYPRAWRGMDLSEVAVAQAKARHLHAEQGDIVEYGPSEFTGYDCVLATEFLEHLDWKTCSDLLGKLNVSEVGQLVFATPWECMPPEEVPEHQVLVNLEWLDAVIGVLGNYTLTVDKKVDESHKVFVFARKG